MTALRLPGKPPSARAINALDLATGTHIACAVSPFRAGSAPHCQLRIADPTVPAVALIITANGEKYTAAPAPNAPPNAVLLNHEPLRAAAALPLETDFVAQFNSSFFYFRITAGGVGWRARIDINNYYVFSTTGENIGTFAAPDLLDFLSRKGERALVAEHLAVAPLGSDAGIPAHLFLRAFLGETPFASDASRGTHNSFVSNELPPPPPEFRRIRREQRLFPAGSALRANIIAFGVCLAEPAPAAVHHR
ncbi:MAG: hypothetical protein LBR07_05670 [Puniceicoccales bacterium]|jgi:hypothetical protein|nr:hypothetical protein [Puniceicoccales bacterium]